MADTDHKDNLPQVTQDSLPAPSGNKELDKLKIKMLALVTDAIDVVHAGIKGTKFMGKRVERQQAFLASQMVGRFMVPLDQAVSGGVHLHLNIPRPNKEPKPVVIEGKPSEGK